MEFDLFTSNHDHICANSFAAITAVANRLGLRQTILDVMVSIVLDTCISTIRLFFGSYYGIMLKETVPYRAIPSCC